LPIAAGLADTTSEVEHLNQDQLLLLTTLSRKVLEMKGQAIAQAFFGDGEDTQPNNSQTDLNSLIGKEG